MKYKNKDIAHLAYLLIKEAGICVRCHSEWQQKHTVLCGKCELETRAYTVQYRLIKSGKIVSLPKLKRSKGTA